MFALRVKLLSLALLPIPSLVQAQDICSSIIQYAARDEIQQNTDARTAYSLYQEHCEGSEFRKDETLSVGIEAVVKAVPASFNLGSGSSEERMSQFCKTYSESGAASSATNIQTSTVVREALEAFNQCIALANRGVLFTPAISKTQINVDVRRGTEDVLLLGVLYKSDILTCTVPNSEDAPTTVAADLTTRKQITGGGSYSVTCERLPATQEDGTLTYPRADLTIMTDRGSLVLPVPSDAEMPYRWASDFSLQINQLNEMNAQAVGRISQLEQQSNDLRSVTAGHSATIARAAATCHAPSFVAVGERSVNGRTVFVRRIATVFDGAVEDYGPAGSGDHLQAYCLLDDANAQTGSVALCLSNDACPWR